MDAVELFEWREYRSLVGDRDDMRAATMTKWLLMAQSGKDVPVEALIRMEPPRREQPDKGVTRIQAIAALEAAGFQYQTG